MNLAQALRFVPLATHLRSVHPSGKILAAFIGAGGKTTALFRLARDLQSSYDSVFVSTSTHLALSQLELADHRLNLRSPADLSSLESNPPPGISVLVGPQAEAERVRGPEAAVLEVLAELATEKRIPLLIEADGSRLRPLKAPADHEPVVPGFINTVVCVAGLSALGQPLTAEWVHRPDRFAALSGLAEGDRLTLEALGRVLMHPQGGLKGIPPGARRVLLLNQADTPALLASARQLAVELLSSFQAVVVTGQNKSSQLDGAAFFQPPVVYEPLAAIVLAACEARRYGKPKQLLEWKGQPFVRHILQAGLSGELSSVLLVTGAYAAEITQAVTGLPVQVVFNPDWQHGLSTSVKMGLRALPDNVGAAFFLLSDQPHLPVELLRLMGELHARTLSPLIAPYCQGRRANPALFDRVVFPDLMMLSGDTGGRSLFAKDSPYSVEWIYWDDPSLLLDVDTPSDYERLLRLGT